ncbi:MAG: PleD family two-component system response regulator [Candidatus Sericytochromatia bacterium]
MNNHNYKILIIENDPVQNKILDHFLSSHKYIVISTYDADMAYSYLQKNKVDLIISDVIMDNISGSELKRKLNKDSILSKIPFIFLTSVKNINIEIEYRELGAYFYMNKPFIKTNLISEIISILEKSSPIISIQ